MEKWSPTNLVPLDKWSLEYYICPEGQAVGIQQWGDQICWGPFDQEDQIFWDYLSMGTVCPVGPNWFGTICPRGQEVGDRKSGEQMSLGPNESQPSKQQNCFTLVNQLLLKKK